MSLKRYLESRLRRCRGWLELRTLRLAGAPPEITRCWLEVCFFGHHPPKDWRRIDGVRLSPQAWHYLRSPTSRYQ